MSILIIKHKNTNCTWIIEVYKLSKENLLKPHCWWYMHMIVLDTVLQLQKFPHYCEEEEDTFQKQTFNSTFFLTHMYHRTTKDHLQED